jgi:tRNA threonylcarbamoyladenosine biosynthesis protein TsaB
MSIYILHIDTTSNIGSVMLSCNGQVLDIKINDQPANHASFVQPAIKMLLDKYQMKGRQIACVAVANGPGSYTGLRVGLSAAKGLCYAWGIPLVAINSHYLMAKAMADEIKIKNIDNCHNILLAPMIDARRQDVFYALFKMENLSILISSKPAVLDASFLEKYLFDNCIYFSGDGAGKWQLINSSTNARFMELPKTGNAFAFLAFLAFQEKIFSDIAYLEPEYSKAFFNPNSKLNS